VKHVDLKSADVLADIAKCALPELSWVVPPGLGCIVMPSVRVLVKVPIKRVTGTTILIAWDDWGEAPKILLQPEGDYQYGLRVPFVFVSAYTRPELMENSGHDFGSVLRFIERNFWGAHGALNFADARSEDHLSGFFDSRLVPMPFAAIHTQSPLHFSLSRQLRRPTPTMTENVCRLRLR
jgi:Phosphoesterase family